MIKTKLDLMDLIKKGQSGIYDKNAWLIRQFAGDIRTVIELNNPLDGDLLVIQIDKFLQIINPDFEQEIAWFKEAKNALKLWVIDIVSANRILGIKNDNTYDISIFEEAIMSKFLLSKRPKNDTIIETNFQTLVELVELGMRRFQH